jgi:hypothetical protein
LPPVLALIKAKTGTWYAAEGFFGRSDRGMGRGWGSFDNFGLGCEAKRIRVGVNA